MKIEKNQEGTYTVNGVTFYQFMSELRFTKVINKNGKEIPKYILFWTGETYESIITKYKCI
jgi:hypothetical protein